MKTLPLFLLAILYAFILLTSFSCEKDESEIIVDTLDNNIYEVKPKIYTPDDWALVEMGQEFDVIAEFTPYGDNTVVEVIEIKFVDYEYGDELHLSLHELVNFPGVYSYTGTELPIKKGRLMLGVCSYKNEVINDGYHPPYFTYDGQCTYRNIFAQDKVGTELKVKTALLFPWRYESLSPNEPVLIDYEYDILEGDSGILTIDILAEDLSIIETILETEITESGNGQLTYQFSETGIYNIKISAQQADGSNENYLLTKSIVD